MPEIVKLLLQGQAVESAFRPPGGAGTRTSDRVGPALPPRPRSGRGGSGSPPATVTSSISTGRTPSPRAAPLVLVLHGLEGSSQSHYARRPRSRHVRRPGLARRRAQLPLVQRGAEPALPRSITPGTPTTSTRSSGCSIGRERGLRLGDRRRVARRQRPAEVAGRARDRSAGRGSSGRWRSRSPFDLASCARVLDRGSRRWVYTANFLRTMRRQGDRQGRPRSGAGSHGRISRGAVRTRTFAELRSRWSRRRSTDSPTNATYWRRASSGPYLRASAGRPCSSTPSTIRSFPGRRFEPVLLPPSVQAESVPRGVTRSSGPMVLARAWAGDAIGFLAPLIADGTVRPTTAAGIRSCAPVRRAIGVPRYARCRERRRPSVMLALRPLR